MKKLLVLVLVLLLLTITVVPVSAAPSGPPGGWAPGWSHMCPGQGGSDNPGPGP